MKHHWDSTIPKNNIVRVFHWNPIMKTASQVVQDATALSPPGDVTLLFVEQSGAGTGLVSLHLAHS